MAVVFHAGVDQFRPFRIRRRNRSVPRSIGVLARVDRVAKAFGGRCSSRTANGRREASMLGSLEPLSEDGPIRQILSLYRRMKEKLPTDGWHDRLIELPGVEPKELSRH